MSKQINLHKRLNLSRNAFWYHRRCEKSGTKPSIVFFAREQQKLLDKELKRVIGHILANFDIEILHRSKVSQYAWKKNPRIKIAGKSFVCFEKGKKLPLKRKSSQKVKKS